MRLLAYARNGASYRNFLFPNLISTAHQSDIAESYFNPVTVGRSHRRGATRMYGVYLGGLYHFAMWRAQFFSVTLGGWILGGFSLWLLLGVIGVTKSDAFPTWLIGSNFEK